MASGSYLRYRGLKDGLLGGHRGWLALGLVMWVARMMKRILSRPTQLISVERLEPGQSVTVSAHSPSEAVSPGRRSRRQQRSRADS